MPLLGNAAETLQWALAHPNHFTVLELAARGWLWLPAIWIVGVTVARIIRAANGAAK